VQADSDAAASGSLSWASRLALSQGGQLADRPWDGAVGGKHQSSNSCVLSNVSLTRNQEVRARVRVV